MKLTPLRFTIAVVAALLGVPAQAQTATIEVNKPTYETGEQITVTFSGGPGNAKDWIGIYRSDEIPGGPTATTWRYVDGTTSGATGLSEGSVVFSGLAAEGDWVVYLLENDGYNILASVPFSVLNTSPELTPDSTLYGTGQPITINFRNGPGNTKDWIGIYKEGETPSSTTPSTLWAYVDGTQSGTTALTEGAISFPAGLAAPGRYMVHMLENDSYTIIGSAALEVTDQLPSVLTHHSIYFPGEPVIVSFANGPGNPRDWIGIYFADEIPDGNPASITWAYVGGTQTAGAGLESGTVTLGSLDFAGDYDAFLLVDDGYETIATNRFSVVDPSATVVRLNKRLFFPGEPITVEFFNAPGNAKDWVGVYEAGEIPDGTPPSIVWSYLDGTQTGSSAVATGTLSFPGGLEEPGQYAIHLMENDGYTVLSSETFFVMEPAGSGVRIIDISPLHQGVNLPPTLTFRAVLTNDFAALNRESVVLRLDGDVVPANVTLTENGAVIEYTAPGLPLPGSTHTFSLSFSDTSTPAVETSRDVTFTIGDYRNITLPAPIHFNNFDAVPEGELPPGWTEQNFTDVSNEFPDLGDLNSLSYRTWTVVNADRFLEPLLSYSTNPTEDYERVLTPNPLNVVGGQIYNQPLASGRLLFANSGYRNGAQIMYLFSPDFNLTGHRDVHVSFHSLWEQNQDSIAALEYSIDQGATWLPVVYMLHTSDIVLNGEEVDAVATFNTERGDIASTFHPETGEPIGGKYGAFIAAPITQELAPYISGRLDDNAVESKRIELFRLPQADNQPNVRFRFAHAGTDSWYWGVDNFGLYSIPGAEESPRLNITRAANGQITITWDQSATGFTLQSTAALGSNDWQPVPGVQNNSVTLNSEGVRFFRLVK